MKKLFILAALLPLSACRSTEKIEVAGILLTTSPLPKSIPGYTQTLFLDTLDGENYHQLFTVSVKTESFNSLAKGKTVSVDTQQGALVKGSLTLGENNILTCKRDYPLETEDPDENPPR